MMRPQGGAVLTDGLVLMVVGMTTVFGFLTVLVAAMHMLSAVVAQIAPPEPEPVAPIVEGPGPELAVVLAAVHHLRSGTGR